MTGPEHYLESERRMRASDWQRQNSSDDADLAAAMHEAAMAQVHATLALAAAVALGQSRMRLGDYDPWVKAASATAIRTSPSGMTF